MASTVDMGFLHFIVCPCNLAIATFRIIVTDITSNTSFTSSSAILNERSLHYCHKTLMIFIGLLNSPPPKAGNRGHCKVSNAYTTGCKQDISEKKMLVCNTTAGHS